MAELLQALMLVADGIGIMASYTLSKYYRERIISKRSILYVYRMFFMSVAGLFVLLTISDLMVIYLLLIEESRDKYWWIAWITVPNVRGLTFRLPFTVLELWMIDRLYGRIVES